jgi:hypothetical protein
MATRTNTRGRCATTGSSQPKRRAVLIIEDDANFRGLTVALLEEGEPETIECESDAAPTRMVSAAGLAPTSGEIVTQIQLGGSRTDSLVRILHAQPRSRLKLEVRRQKVKSWTWTCSAPQPGLGQRDGQSPTTCKVDARSVIRLQHCQAIAPHSFATTETRRAQRMASAAAPLLRAYVAQVEALRRLRNGNSQTVRVEHVHVLARTA